MGLAAASWLKPEKNIIPCSTFCVLVLFFQIGLFDHSVVYVSMVLIRTHLFKVNLHSALLRSKVLSLSETCAPLRSYLQSGEFTPSEPLLECYGTTYNDFCCCPRLNAFVIQRTILVIVFLPTDI